MRFRSAERIALEECLRQLYTQVRAIGAYLSWIAGQVCRRQPNGLHLAPVEAEGEEVLMILFGADSVKPHDFR